MPVYPCVKCNLPVDPTADRVCKNCREAKPLECSRCNKRIPTEEVFDREKLRTKKPIFCLECGETEKVVKCGLCNLSLQKHQGKQVTSSPTAPVYHPHCLREREKQMDRLGKIRPIMAVVGLILGGLVGYTYLQIVGAVAGGALLAALFFMMINALIRIMSPK